MTHSYTELDLAWNDLKEQDGLYQPTSFWRDACAQIREELIHRGIENFRRLPTSTGFFVPTYGYPGNNLDRALINKIHESIQYTDPNRKSLLAITQFLSGELSALADYRVLLAADDGYRKPWLHHFSESSFGNPIEQFTFDRRFFSRSSLNYLLGLAMLKKHLKDIEEINVLEVGGGFGTLGEILAAAGFKRWRYIDIDIPPNSFIAQKYLSAALGSASVAGYADTRSMGEIIIDKLPEISALCSWQIQKLAGHVDLFVNFISFQEMEPYVVSNYLSHGTRLGAKWVLLRNMREGKNLVSADCNVGVESPTTSEDYINMLPDYQLIDRNVLPFGFRTVDGFNSELLLFKRRE